MSEKTTMNRLFEKLNDLQEVFRYGQKAIPVIYNIVDFMRETIPLLEGINQSIAESTSKIPKAKHQIDDVTNATELATTEILDLVDAISGELETVKSTFNGLKHKQKDFKKEIDEILKLVEGNDKATDKLLSLKTNLDVDDNIDAANNIIDKINNDAYSITLSLQVQDITSQQLAAVNHLIESVRNKLSSLVHTIGDTTMGNTTMEDFNLIGDEEKTNLNFDQDAKYNKDKSRQELVDSIIGSQSNPVRNKNTSQEEIDKLFS